MAMWIPYAVSVLVFVGLVFGVVYHAVPTNTLGVVAGGFPSPIQHVFTIILENAGLSTVLSTAPYLKTLYNTYAGASNYYGVCHPSAPNYLAMTSGELLQCGTDNVNSYPATNIANLVSNAGETWDAYFQSMPSPCYPSWSSDSLYKPGHNPFIYYSNLQGGGLSSLCQTHDLPLSSFNPSSTPPNYVFLAPNLLNDGHNTSIAYASSWLSSYLPSLLAEPWASSTVFFVVIDEGDPSDSSGYAGLDGGHTYLTAVSQYSKGVGLYTSDSSPYSLLSTIEWLLGTGNTGAHDSQSQFGPMKSMFNFGSQSGNPTVSLSVSPSSINVGATTAYASSVTGGTPPYSYSWATLPPGCGGIGGSSGSCQPLSAGTFQTILTVTDSLGAQGTASTTLKVTTQSSSLSVVASVSPGSPSLNQSFTLSASVTGGLSPYQYAWSSLPTGCTGALAASSISCTATTTGVDTPSVTVTDSTGASVTANLNFTVSASSPPPPGPALTEATGIALAASAGIAGGIAVAWGLRRPEIGVGMVVISGVILFVL